MKPVTEQVFQTFRTFNALLLQIRCGPKFRCNQTISLFQNSAVNNRPLHEAPGNKIQVMQCLGDEQLLNEPEQDMKNSAGRGGCYPQRPKAEAENILRDLQNSSYPTKAEYNNCFIIHSKYFQTLKGENELYF